MFCKSILRQMSHWYLVSATTGYSIMNFGEKELISATIEGPKIAMNGICPISMPYGKVNAKGKQSP
jgi:hypothetical protein